MYIVRYFFALQLQSNPNFIPNKHILFWDSRKHIQMERFSQHGRILLTVMAQKKSVTNTNIRFLQNTTEN